MERFLSKRSSHDVPRKSGRDNPVDVLVQQAGEAEIFSKLNRNLAYRETFIENGVVKGYFIKEYKNPKHPPEKPQTDPEDKIIKFVDQSEEEKFDEAERVFLRRALKNQPGPEGRQGEDEDVLAHELPGEEAERGN